MSAAIRNNIIANYGGAVWRSLMGVIFIPVYIKFMGIESYGHVGVFGSLTALFGVLDLGLGATMTRETARLSATDPSGREAWNPARTLERIYWAVALVLGLGVTLLAGPIAAYWVKADRLDPETIRRALMISGAVIALRWPCALYAGGLRGLDCQPLLNLMECVAGTVRGLGAVVVLWLVSPTIQAFFSWQIVVSALETLCFATALRRSLPRSGGPGEWSVAALRRV